jgi:peptide/nickel transport system permease protein
MLTYIVKKILLFIPTWLAVSVVIFGLSKMTTDDPVVNKLNNAASDNGSTKLSDAEYTQMAQDMGLDKPVFYFSMSAKAYPKDLYTILRKDERTAMSQLIKQYGNAEPIFAYRHSIKEALSTPDTAIVVNNTLQQLLLQDNDATITLLLNELKKETANRQDILAIDNAYQFVKNKATRNQLYIPTFYWYSIDNQYHTWLTSFLKGDFGIANNGQNIWTRISTPLSITLLLSLCTIVFSYLLGVPLGIYLAMNKGNRKGKWLSSAVFAIYALPTFWLAMLAIRFLTTPEYGIKIFPHAGLGDFDPNSSIPAFLFNNIPYFILPILCLIIHPTMYIARLTLSSIQDNLGLDYVRTAQAKGLKKQAIFYKHVLKNALFPLITLFGQLLPLLITGSFIIEFIFNIKGMGITIFEALGERDWYIVYTIFMFSTLLILIGNLMADVLYKWVNPRVVLA